MEFEFVDRYQALGIPYPDPETMCPGQCEGIGLIPVHFSETDAILRNLWIQAEVKQREQIKKGKKRASLLLIRGYKKNGRILTDLDDGYHFVKCPDCNGTGKIQGGYHEP